MEDTHSFGYWVMRRRKALDLTRSGLAQRVNCSPETIKKIERDERRPSSQMAELLAEALSVPDDNRELFLQAARGERPVDSLAVVSSPLARLTSAHNLPPQSTPFVGREAELAALGVFLADPAIRLITILGPGGMGKTRLALAAAEAQLHDPHRPFPHGVYFVSLARVGAPEQLIPAVAEALNFRFYLGSEPRAQLIDYLRRKRILLLLDNFEHLKAGAGLVDQWLIAAPELKVLITSREKLSRQAEQLFPISGLDLPDPVADGDPADEDWAASGAIRLFVQSARRVQPDFTLTQRNRPYVYEMCRLVGGAPLGIFLAASWLDALSEREIVAEIRRDLDFLAVELADVPERQRSLRATFNHSWRLLTEPERAVFRRLSVFRGGFDRAAAVSVAAATPRDLQALVNKSLLVQTAGRYDVHELLRQFAAERLNHSPDEEAATRERHSTHYCNFLYELTEDWHNARQLETLEVIAYEADNARPALQWALEQKEWRRLRRALTSWMTYLQWQGRMVEGIDFCRMITTATDEWANAEIINPPDCLRLRAVTLAWMSLFAAEVADYHLASSTVQQSLALLARPELAEQDVRRETVFAHLVGSRDPYREEEWRQHPQRALALSQELGDLWLIAESLDWLAYADWWGEGRLTAGLEKLKNAYAIRQQIGDWRGQITALSDLALIYKHLGHLDEAERMQREVLSLVEEQGMRPEMSMGYMNLGYTLHWQGRYEEAIHLIEEGWAIAQDMGQDMDVFAMVGIASNLLHAGQYQEDGQRLNMLLGRYEEMPPRPEPGVLLGLLALVEANYAEGQALFEKNIAIAGETTKHLSTFWLGDLVLADYYLKQLTPMREHLAQMLTRAMTNENYMATAFALPGAALYVAAAGDVTRAVEIRALAQRTPIMANSRYYEDMAWREVTAAADFLPPAIVTAAQERGRALDLWTTARELLDWLESNE